MHLELVELLRCPRPHALSVLVAASDRTSARYVMEGVLGCPECGAEYAIRAGVTEFANADVQLPGSRSTRVADEVALRVAAQLAMHEGRAVYALVGYSAHVALKLRELVSARLLLVNATDINALGEPGATLSSAPAGVVHATNLLPLVAAKFAGVAFAATPSEQLLNQATNALSSGGRLVASAQCALPSGVSELVRDTSEWVATRNAVASAPVGITRR